MESQAKIAILQDKFANKQKITTAELFDFFRSNHTNLSNTAIHWRIYQLKEGGIISSLGKGLYYWTKDQKPKHEFKGKISSIQKSYSTKIKLKYPDNFAYSYREL